MGGWGVVKKRKQFQRIIEVVVKEKTQSRPMCLLLLSSYFLGLLPPIFEADKEIFHLLLLLIYRDV